MRQSSALFCSGMHNSPGAMVGGSCEAAAAGRWRAFDEHLGRIIN